MQLYNSLSQTVEPLRFVRGPVLVYTCGITPYDTTHLGHAFTYASVDLLVRYLEHRGHAVRYVQNVTDIDDDILRTAKNAGEDWKALGDRWTVHFIEDMISLNVRPPDVFPRATDVIADIVDAVERLLAAGKAYAVDGSVYYDLTSWPTYGRLSGLTRDEMLPLANERGNKPDDPHKRDPLDFVLWQAQAPGEPAWDSPWGPGRPGWHIECSTMAAIYLGDSLDVHAGGGDLIFPHHESEVAQAEPLTGREFVRAWMHVAMVRHEGEKMSKSLGNLVMVRDVLRRGTADGLRLYLAGHHYRSPWSFDEGELQAAQARADRWQEALGGLDGRAPATEGAELPRDVRRGFDRAMDDDLDAPAATRLLDELAEDILAARVDDLAAAQAELQSLAGVLGLRLGRGPSPSVSAGWGQHLLRFAAHAEGG